LWTINITNEEGEPYDLVIHIDLVEEGYYEFWYEGWLNNSDEKVEGQSFFKTNKAMTPLELFGVVLTYVKWDIE
jgi:hypothetical protein